MAERLALRIALVVLVLVALRPASVGPVVAADTQVAPRVLLNDEEIARPVPAPAASASAAPHAARFSGRELVVGAGREYRRIGDALRAAADGDRIRITAGTYAEGPLVVTRSVALIGQGWPVLDGEGRHTVLAVEADGVEVRGLVLRGSGVSYTADHAALRIEGGRGCLIAGNRFEENFFGIYLAKARECVVTGNTLVASGTREAASGNGIHLWNAEQTRIEGNTIRGHRDGIYLEHSRDAVIQRNVSEDNLRYGLHFMFSHRTVYEANEFRRNGAGVAVMYSRDVKVLRNRFEDNHGATSYGLLAKEITDSRIEGNIFRRNTTGLLSDGSGKVEVVGNEFRGNGWAVRLMASSQDNRFADNNFIDNTFDVTTNSRRNFNTFVGNYWSRYDGWDLAGDGFGDVPHRPVRLFALIVERTPAALVLVRSVFVDLLDVAERVLPVLTPETLTDEKPRMREVVL
jgi:nitrous oxidase accessory protein